jgi:ADP-ribose pyrophosphatase YjhB (NUDIX family)
MKFCGECGAPVRLSVPPGDHLPRYVCDACGTIHYLNPRLVVGCVPEHEGRILLCRRAIEPRRGYWTVPAGFMENDETLQQAAARESREEALAEVTIGSLLSVVHVLHAHQVHVFFRATLPAARYGVGAESLEVALVEPGKIPWEEIAFPSTDFTLRRYLEDKAAGREQHHFTTIDRRLRSAPPEG